VGGRGIRRRRHRQSIARIKASPFVPHRDALRGFVFGVATGTLKEVAS
jgi:carbonic anhydrase